MACLGLDTYRFTVEWARVEPAEGQFSAEALAHYRAIIDRCLVVTEPLGAGIAWAVTLNEPNLPRLLSWPEIPAAAGRDPLIGGTVGAARPGMRRRLRLRPEAAAR